MSLLNKTSCSLIFWVLKTILNFLCFWEKSVNVRMFRINVTVTTDVIDIAENRNIF